MFLLDPLLGYSDVLFDERQLLWGGVGPEFRQPILAGVELGLVVVLHLVDHAHAQVHPRHLLLPPTHPLPLTLATPSQLASLQSLRRHLRPKDPVFVQRNR
jgi:hypothetical protein